ncbi:MAG TPA: hypothetical protein VNT20_14250 [Flavisolibacter sp.]|jgi:hypothetical protein|nr:hypothetical protein [Flavisolibacter sp.]
MQSNEIANDNQSQFVQAFCKFAGCSEDELEVSIQNGHTDVIYNGVNYRVSTYGTLSRDFEEMFEARAYDRIAIEIQETVWIEFIQHIDPFSTSDFIISLYKEWNQYWKTREAEINNERAYSKLRSESWEQLIILIETVKITTTFVSINRAKLDRCFLPIIALALRQQYEFIDHFCDELIDVMSEAGLDNMSFGDTYKVVFIGGEREGEFEEQFYIYNPPDSGENSR